MSENNGTMPLGEVASLYDSLHKTPSYGDEGIAMVRVTDIRRGYVDLTDTKKVDEATFEEFTKKYAPTVGDTLFTRVGSYGNSCFVNQPLKFCLGQNTVCITPAPDRVNPFYLYCCLNSPQIRQQIDSFVGGASQPTISLKNIRLLGIPTPPLPTQRKIASILSAYDDLIENNTRRIANLEEMAQAIYREWFVNFRFPGHENVKLVDSPLGQIPEGWEPTTLGAIANVNARSIKKGNAPDNINYIDIKSVSTGRINEIRPMPFSESPGRARRIVRHGDVIWSTVRPVRRSYSIILDPLPDTIASTGFAVLSANAVPFSFLYLATTTDAFATYLVNHATGSAYPAVNGKDFENAGLILPSQDIVAQFDEAVGDMLLLAHRLLIKNVNLRATRDLLLPKLISGKLDVEDLDIDLGLTAEALEEATA